MSLFQQSKGCSQCCEGRLEMKDFVRANCVDETGNRYPDSWTYYECDRCGFRTKEFEDGRTEIADGDEWDQICSE